MSQDITTATISAISVLVPGQRDGCSARRRSYKGFIHFVSKQTGDVSCIATGYRPIHQMSLRCTFLREKLGNFAYTKTLLPLHGG